MTDTADAIDNLIAGDNKLVDVAKEVEVPKTLTLGSLGGLAISTPEFTTEWRNYLFYGHSGIGKTILAASSCEVEDMAPVLIIDVEGGTSSLTRFHPSVHVIRVKNFVEFNQLYADLRGGKHPYKTVVLDSVTEIQKFGMYAIMKDLLSKDPERDPDLPGIQEWAKNTEQIRRLVRAFRDLPMHTIITCLAVDQQNDQGQVIRTYPNLSNKLALELPGFFDVVGYYYIREVRQEDGSMRQVRLLLTQSTQRVVAKDRLGLPTLVEDPTMLKLTELTKG